MDELSHTVWMRCPLCGYSFSRSRNGGPQREMHARGTKRQRKSCRLVVTPDPLAPDFDPAHRIEKVPENRSIEDLVDERGQEWEAEYGVGSYIRGQLTGVTDEGGDDDVW